MSAAWSQDILYCASCKMFSIPVPEIPETMCPKCGEMSGIRIAAFHQSKPIPIPPKSHPPPRLESPRLTPNMAPAVFQTPPGISNLAGHVLVFHNSVIDNREEEEAAAAAVGDFSADAEIDLAVQESLADAPSPEIRPADPELLKSMQRFKYIPLGTTPTSCAICMDDFSPGDDLVKTQCCGGITHHTCMDSTLCVIPSCPFCRSSKLSSSAPSSSLQFSVKK